jgi:hypothetical protein
MKKYFRASVAANARHNRVQGKFPLRRGGTPAIKTWQAVQF